MFFEKEMPARSVKIGRNELCPCGSKKKYKFCHGGVDAQPMQKPGQIDAQLKKLSPKPICLAPTSFHGECSNKVVASHTVSRSGSLGAIAKNGHVYSYVPSLQSINALQGKISPELRGWKDASTFPGFCSTHDKDIFSALEDEPFTGSKQQCFLLGYRSIA